MTPLILMALLTGAPDAAPPPPPAAERASPPPEGGRGALSGAELDTLVGGDAGVAVAMSTQQLRAVNTGNRITADQVVTGSISLDRNALSNFSGLGNFVVNTGNNNNLQSSMSLSVVMPPR